MSFPEGNNGVTRAAENKTNRTKMLRFSVRGQHREHARGTDKHHVLISVGGPLTNGLPASKKRSGRSTSRVIPMRTAVRMCAATRTAVPNHRDPSAHKSTPSNRRSICNAAASRPGPLAKSVSLSTLRSRFIRLIPSRGSIARNSTPAPTPGSSAATLSMYDTP